MDKSLETIRKHLGHLQFKWTPSLYLDTGFTDLNAVIGNQHRGIPYGRLIEISGLESHGKTALAMTLAALAQQNKAGVVWGDLENSFESDWGLMRGLTPCPACQGKGRESDGHYCKECGTSILCDICDGGGCALCENSGQVRGCGLDMERFTLIQPYVGTFEEDVVDENNPKGKKKKKQGTPRLATGQELCEEMEEAMVLMHKKFDRQIVVLDSIPSILVEEEAAAGLSGSNLRSNMELPMFLGKLMRRWVGLAQCYNASILFVNQLRQNPMKRFGDPWYSPGGNAPRFFCHIRVRVWRTKGGRVMHEGKMRGIQGLMKAMKNKSGGVEGARVGYRILFDGPVEFVEAGDLKKAGEEEGAV